MWCVCHSQLCALQYYKAEDSYGKEEKHDEYKEEKHEDKVS